MMKNRQETIARNRLFLKRQLTDGILFKSVVTNNPFALTDVRDNEWKERECLAVSDKEYVIKHCKAQAQVYRHIDDDTIEEGYPTLHFGESFYSAMLGGQIKFVGTASHTCSGASPIIFGHEDMERLKGYENSPWTKTFEESARYFARETDGDFWLQYIITIDALNLVVELLGTTEAYAKVIEDESLIRKIMDFGVEFNEWFYKLQKGIYQENNRCALACDELYELYDKTWYSIDAYDLTSTDVYKKLGFEYQQELIKRVGGGVLHTHGTGLLKHLPMLAKLQGLSILQLGRDLYNGEEVSPGEFLKVRKAAGDIPLRIYINKEEFQNGIKNRTLPGGAEYICRVNDIEEANKLAYMAKEYKI